MKIKRLSKSFVPLCALLVLAGCAGRPGPAPGEPDTAAGPVVGPRWNLLLVGTDERLEMPETPHFMVAPDGRVSGSDGCNRLTGRAALGENHRIEFSGLTTTRGTCPRAEDAERVRAMLETAYRYLIDHDRLVFFGPDQRVLGGWRRAGG